MYIITVNPGLIYGLYGTVHSMKHSKITHSIETFKFRYEHIYLQKNSYISNVFNSIIIQYYIKKFHYNSDANTKYKNVPVKIELMYCIIKYFLNAFPLRA